MTDRTVKVTIEAAVAGAIANVQAFKGTLVGLGSEIDKAAVKHPDSLNKIASATGKLGLVAAVGFGLVVKSAMDFDKQMSAVVAVSDNGSKSLGALRDAAIAAGRDTAYTATQAGKAEEELAKAGVSTKDILGGALKASLNLAAAGTLDLGEAATISAQAMNEFQLTGKDAGRIADDLASAANASAADVSGLGLALGQVGGVAHQVGLSLEDTIGVLADFTQQGMNGEEAGTTLKQMLLKLTGPSKEAGDLMKRLGLNIYDAQGHFVGITAVAQSLHDTLGPLTEAQRNAALATIFGARAIRGATVLYQQGAQGLQDWIDKSSVSGQAAETAAKKLDNLSGDLKKLEGSLQAVAISSSGGTTKGLRDLAQGAEATVNWFLKLPGPVGETGTVLLGLSAASLLATSGLLKVKTTVTGAMEALRGLGPVGSKAATVLGSIGKAGGIIGVAAVAAFGLWEGFKALSAWFDKSSQPVHRDITRMTSDLKEFAETGVATGEMAKAFGSDLRKLGKDVEAVAVSHKSLAQLGKEMNAQSLGPAGTVQAHADAATAGKKAGSDIAALDKALADVASGGGATQAKLAFDKITQSLVDQGVPLAQATAMFPQYAHAAADAAVATSPLGQGFADVGAQADVMARGLQDAIDHGQSLDDVFKELNGAALDFLGSTIGEKQALADLKESFDKNGSSIDLNTQKGRDNMKVIADSITGAEKAAQAKFTESGSVEAASATYNDYIGQLRKTMIQGGLTAKQADAIIQTYAKFPPSIGTDINVRDNATEKILSIQSHLNALQNRTITVTTFQDTVTGATRTRSSSGPSSFNRWGGLYEHAAVGTLRDASVYAPAGRGRYVIAERETGGEAFVPKHGSYGRSMAILSHAAGWYGATVSPGKAPATYVDSRTVTYAIYDATDPGKVVAAIKAYERSNGKAWRDRP